MKTVPIIFFVLLAFAPASAVTIPVTEVASHVGETATVEGVVSGVHTARSSDVTFIDMGGSYPNNVFTGVIFAADADKVGDVSGLPGKTVGITGQIKLYKGKPEIIVKSASQIVVH